MTRMSNLLLVVFVLCLVKSQVFCGVISTPYGAIVSNGPPCATIGSAILNKGGSGVDVAIATGLCEGLASPQSTGIGGGCLITIYDSETGKAYVVNGRETAPSKATDDMFVDHPEKSMFGGKSVAVPGELIAYYEAHKRFGKLPWKDLVEPNAILAREGIPITNYLANVIQQNKEDILRMPSIAKLLTSPKTGNLLVEGELLKRPKLADTLEAVAIDGPQVIYNGIFTDSIVEEIQADGGIIMREDLEQYRVEWQEPMKFPLSDNLELLSTPPPGSGLVLGAILSIMKAFYDTKEPASEEIVSQRFTEAMKYGFGIRSSLGDPNFVNLTEIIANITDPEYGLKMLGHISDTNTSQNAEDYGGHYYTKPSHGTANFGVLIPGGLSVSVTSTVNLYFGSMLVSESTGIIFNDEMDDFSTPDQDNGFGVAPSPYNFIEPGKRPLSSMTPSIIVDKTIGIPILVVGASGGPKITTTTALIIYDHIFNGLDLHSAIRKSRIHHQLFPMTVFYEQDVKQNILDYLAKVGHNLEIPNVLSGGTGVSYDYKLKKFDPSFDPRRGGSSMTVNLHHS